MSSIVKRVCAGICLLLFGAAAFSLYVVWRQQQKIEQQIARVTLDKKEAILGPVTVNERIVTDTSQAWRTIQEKIKDTVVQVYAQRADFDFMQPYRTPEQYSATGSGFFINANGDLITNAHVVDQSKSIWIQIPSLGKRIIEVDIVGVSPERDVALLRVKPDDVQLIRKVIGQIPFLSLGNSDIVHRSDEVLALGYPLGQQSLKSTTGVISGREQNLIQMSAPINPGSSGGPLLNINGEVVGINSSGVTSAQNVGYIIPINDLKIILPDLYKIKLLRKPFLGVLFNNATEGLTDFLGNPLPGGCYVVEVVKNSTLYKAGVQIGDMLYEINGSPIDIYGDMTVPWSEDKLSVIHYVSRLSIGEDVNIVFYRKGQRKEVKVKFSQAELPAIRRVFPAYEEIDYEAVAGMVVMPLTLNHIQLLISAVPGLAKYTEIIQQTEPALIVTHIFPSSQLFKTRTLAIGSTINEVNGIKVKTLEDFRAAFKKVKRGYLTLKACDNVARLSDNVFVVLSFDKIIEEEPTLSRDYRFPLSPLVQDFLKRDKAK
jgi:serine protease Do